VLAIGVVGADSCVTTGAQSKDFGKYSLVIPMDNCYQKRDASSAQGGQTTACNVTADDGIFRAYGLVFFLLKHNVPVYWAIDGATPKSGMVGLDVTVPKPATVSVVKRFDWSSGSIVDYAIPGCTSNCGFPAGTDINYIGGPFIIDAANAPAALALFASDPDFARFKTEALVDIHEAENAFTAKEVRPLSGPPPKIAILNIRPGTQKTSVNVMYEYAVAAGLSWPCKGNGDCAGGVTGTGVNTQGSPGQGCDVNALYTYLASPNGDPAHAQSPSPCGAGVTCAPKFNSGPGLVYDILCDNDFYTSTGVYANTKLATNGYKLLWAPHWEEGNTQANATPVVPLPASPPAGDVLGLQLQSIHDFVEAGNNLFAECHAIVTLEGGHGSSGDEHGLPVTRFQSQSSMTQTNASATTNVAFDDPAFTDPNMQVGDFTFSVVNGSVSAYLPDAAASQYVTGVKRLATETANGDLDVATSVVMAGGDGLTKGSVAYLGGHRYAGQTAGTRIVLNTLFNLGFACADPNTVCNTGLLGACSKGKLKCASGGGTQCVPDTGPVTEICGNNIDDDCNGAVDDGSDCNKPECTSGQTQPCQGGPAEVGPCKTGTQTCTGGTWGECKGQVLPTPEVCNGKDDNCSGTADDGSLCSPGFTCSFGACLPDTCGVEQASCPEGFTCGSGFKCQPISCPTSPCAAGTICRIVDKSNGTLACVDPCQGVTCGNGASCSGGTCVAGGCALHLCDAVGQTCVAGECVTDPCAAANCPTGTFCRLGDCVRSCTYVDCAKGQHCNADGFCESTCEPACGPGQLCVNGSCGVDQLCVGVACGLGQTCKGGDCLDDPCTAVSCPTGATCTGGQCMGAAVTTSTTRAVSSPKSSGGCGSTGPGGLLSIALALLAAGWRRLPRAPRAAGMGLALFCAAATGCSKQSAGVPSCTSPQTLCGSACADLASAADNCGVCGKSCASGYLCLGAGCVLDTHNPFLASVDPGVLAQGGKVTLHLSGQGFETGAKVRVLGPGVNKPALDLALTDKTSGTVDLDLSGASLGSAEVRVINPPNLVSNAVAVSVQVKPVLGDRTPATVRQDGATFMLSLIGRAFASGAKATLKLPGGTGQDFDTTYVDAGTLTVNDISPATLAVGTYDLTVTIPGALPTAALKFTVTEGMPTLSSISATCAKLGDFLTGTVTGTNLYPSSVVLVSGGTIQNMPVETTCPAGTDALGRCAQLHVEANLAAAPANCYMVTVRNPGPLTSTATLGFRVAVDCTGAPSCP
jgi:hypothetical protein